MEDHPIHLAAQRGDLSEVQSLITEDPALMELRGSFYRTPLLIAAERGHAEMVLWLLDQGADPEAQDPLERDALHLASLEGHIAIVSILLDRGFDVNRRDGGGFVSLMIAAYAGHVGVVEILLSRKEIEMDRQNDEGWTALYLASLRDDPEVIDLLVQAGADPRIAGRGGRTPVDQARYRGYEECIQLLEVSQ